jgi:NAD(P)H-dependent FMN reductase
MDGAADTPARCSVYRRRRPERTPLYRVVQGHLETYLALAREGHDHGGARVQYDLRRILGQIWAHVLPRPEVFIGMGPGKFADGKLTDESTRNFLTDLLTSFKPWMERMRVKKK